MSDKVDPLSLLGKKPGRINKLPFHLIKPNVGKRFKDCFKVLPFVGAEQPFDVFKQKYTGLIFFDEPDGFKEKTAFFAFDAFTPASDADVLTGRTEADNIRCCDRSLADVLNISKLTRMGKVILIVGYCMCINLRKIMFGKPEACLL